MEGVANKMKPGGKTVMTSFGLMESCADAMVVGCPQLAKWAFTLLEGKDAIPKVSLAKLKVSPTIEKFYSNPQLDDASLATECINRAPEVPRYPPQRVLSRRGAQI